MAKKTSPLTKAQLLDTIDMLRKEIKELKANLGEIQEKKSSAKVKFDKVALGLYKTDKADYRLVKIGYDPISGEAGLISDEFAAKNTKSFPVAMGALDDAQYHEIEEKIHE